VSLQIVLRALIGAGQDHPTLTFAVSIGARRREVTMQVTAFSTPTRPEWRWRICDYGGEIIEESYDRFLTIAAAVAQGAQRLAHMDALDRVRRTPTVRRRGR
jgi:hypothetical protein